MWHRFRRGSCCIHLFPVHRAALRIQACRGRWSCPAGPGKHCAQSSGDQHSNRCPPHSRILCILWDTHSWKHMKGIILITKTNLKENNSKCHRSYSNWHVEALMAQIQSWFERSPVITNLIHTSASILTPMLNTIIDIYTAVLTRPARCTDTGVATGIIQHTVASIGTWLLTEERAIG